MIRRCRRILFGMGCLARAGRDLLFPPCCAYCGAELADSEGADALCGACLAALAPAAWHGCRRCAGALANGAAADDVCPQCRNAPLKFDAVVALGDYHAGLREAVLRMKRPAHDELSSALGRLLAERRCKELAAFQADVIVPIPMFWGRRLLRGKNSPDTLAGCLARALDVPVRRALVRHRRTLPQAGLRPRERFRNVRGAFRAPRPEAVRGARVLLVDDVLTTGATCSEAAGTLKRAGATAVAVAVVARAAGQ